MANGNPQELILDPDRDSIDNFPPGKWARDSIDSAVYGSFDKARTGLANFSMTGLGKGALVTALTVFAIGALLVGSLAGADMLPPHSAPALLSGGIPESFVGGAWAGVKAAGAFLMSGLGAVTLFSGAAIGGVMQERSDRQRTEAENMALRHALMEQAKGRQQQPFQGHSNIVEQPVTVNQPSFVEREQQRRAQSAQAQGANR